MTIAPTRIPAPDVVTTQTAADYWQARLDQFRDVNGREPREDSSDMEERKVAKAAWGFNLVAACAPVPAPAAPDAPSELATAAWHAKMHEYISWVKRHGRRPGPVSGPDDELSLNQWLARQRREAREGRLHEAFVLNLEGLEQVVQSNLPAASRRATEPPAIPAQDAAVKPLELSVFLNTIGWDPKDAEAVFDSPEVRWSANFNAVSDWCYYMHSQPRHDFGSEERKLGLWLRAERRAMDEGHLTAEKEQALRSLDTYPVRPTPARPNLDLARAAVRWFERNETVPNRFGSPIEGVLSRWIYKYRGFHDDGTLSPEIAGILSVAPHWLTAQTGKSRGGEDARKWRRTLHEVAHWQETHGYLPVTRGGGGAEMRLSYWLQAQRDLHKAGRLRQEHIDALSTLGPWYEGDIAERTLAFIKEHGRWPDSQAEDAAERTLAGAGRSRREEILALGVPAQRKILHQSTWDEKFIQLQSWTEANCRLPKMRAPDKHESMLANFINMQRRKLAAGKLSADREELLRTIPGVFEQRVKERSAEEWQILVDAFIEEHGRVPRAQADGKHERSLARARTRHKLRAASPEAPRRNAAYWQEKLDAYILENGTLPNRTSNNHTEARLAEARSTHKLAPRIPGRSRAVRQQMVDAYIEELRSRQCPRGSAPHT